MKGSLDNPKWFIYGTAAKKHPFGAFIFKIEQEYCSVVYNCNAATV